MKVYIIVPDCDGPVAVFSTQEKAEEWRIKTYGPEYNKNGCGYDIQEWKVDK